MSFILFGRRESSCARESRVHATGTTLGARVTRLPLSCFIHTETRPLEVRCCCVARVHFCFFFSSSRLSHFSNRWSLLAAPTDHTEKKMLMMAPRLAATSATDCSAVARRHRVRGLEFSSTCCRDGLPFLATPTRFHLHARALEEILQPPIEVDSKGRKDERACVRKVPVLAYGGVVVCHLCFVIAGERKKSKSKLQRVAKKKNLSQKWETTKKETSSSINCY